MAKKFIDPYGASKYDGANGADKPNGADVANVANGQSGNVFTQSQLQEKFPENDGVVDNAHYAGVYDKPATEVPGTEQNGADGANGANEANEANEANMADGAEKSIWENGFAKGMASNKDMTINEAWGDYNAWAKANGKEPLDILEVYPYMQKGYDITKTVEANEQDEKKRQRRENWEKTANVLTHLGNFIGTMFGGISTTKELEDPVELTKRQQLLRDKTLAQRQQSAKDFYQMWKQRQADDYRQQNLELKSQQLDAKIKDMANKEELLRFKAETDREFKKASIELRYKVLEVQQQLAEKRITIAEANAQINALRADLQKQKLELDQQGKVEEYEKDLYGNTVRKTTKPAGSATPNEPTGPNKPSGKKPNPMKS